MEDNIPKRQKNQSLNSELKRSSEVPLFINALHPFILDSMDEYAIIILSSEAIIESWSKGAEKITGFLSAEMIGTHFSKLFIQEDIDSGAPDLEITTALNTGKAIDERYHVRKNSPSFIASGFLFCLKDSSGNQIGFTKIFRDVSDHKELEKQKDDSVGVVSHELKTPITGIKGYAEILSQKLQASSDQSILKPLGRIISLCDRLTSLVNYLLEVSRSQSLDVIMHREAFCFEMLILDVLDEVLASTRTSHTIEFHAENKTYVFADPGRIAQVITNLLTNAIKYSTSTGIIQLELTTINDFVVFKVKDSGLGIPIDQQKLIFKRFGRSQNVKKLNLPGVGLGLYISSEIIKLHQGEMGFESVENSGSTFWFKIPRLFPQAASE